MIVENNERLSFITRWSLAYVLLWALSWSTLFNIWPASLDPGAAPGLLHGFHQWLALHLFGAGAENVDRVSFAFTLLLSCIAAWAWLKLDRTRANEPRLFEASRIATRYVLAAVLITYAIPQLAAIYARQPDPIEWATPLGALTPMDILEFSNGESPPFQLLNGAMFFIAGALLFFRRTTTLGALIALLVLGNIAKLVSGYWFADTHPEIGLVGPAGQLLVMVAFLIVPELKTLIDFFILNRTAVRPHAVAPEQPSPLVIPHAALIKGSVIAIIVVPRAYHTMRVVTDVQHKSALYGVYEVERFSSNGVDQPIAYEMPTRWRTVAIGNYADRIFIQPVRGTGSYYVLGAPSDRSQARWRTERQAETSVPAGTLALTPMDRGHASLTASLPNGKGAVDTLRYTRATDGKVTLAGRVNGDMVQATLNRVADTTFALHHHRWW